MEYERIHKVQTGIISPSKLRMKLMGSPQKRKDGSNSNSSRTSPARMEDSEFINNSLLASSTEDFGYEVQSLNTSSVTTVSKENGSSTSSHDTKQQPNSSVNSSAVHPVKYMEDENLDYDSNASSSSFEFHKGERAVRSLSRSFSRPTSYKWNDAEKWIMNKQSAQSNHSRAHSANHHQGNRVPMLNMVRVAPEAAGYDYRFQPRLMEAKRVDLCQPLSQMNLEKFSFAHAGPPSNSLANLYPQTRDLEEIVHTKLPANDTSGTPTIREVSMRDMGTEMTPIPSQEPSRTGTPVGATTPIRSPTSSLPSTPRRGDATTSPKEFNGKSYSKTGNGRRELSEEEQKLKTRREIVALGVQLGKMNIAAWASKDGQENSGPDGVTDAKDVERLEFEQHASAWEEAEKSKQGARFKREEIKIIAWENQQKHILEAEMRKIEAKVEEMRTYGQAKMMKKIAMARKQSDEKRAAAEARRNRQAERIAAQSESIRQTGRIPTLDYLCCGLF